MHLSIFKSYSTWYFVELLYSINPVISFIWIYRESFTDSIIADLSRYSNIWKRYFKSLNALNSGIGGDRVRNNLWRCQNLPSIQHLQHLMCVVSNIQHNSVENVVDGIVEIPLSLRCKHYPIILFFCCLLPRDNNWSINNQLASV